MTVVPLYGLGAGSLAIQALVARLHDLHDGPLALPEIIALGTPAVPALEAFLRGPSQSLHHQRVLAADALGAIGGEAASTALLRALRDCTTRALDPLPLQAEDVVVSRIIEHLSHRMQPQVTDALLDALRRRPYPACVSALGESGDERAIGLLIDCLHEDPARSAAVQALRRFGAPAIAPLRTALATRCDVDGVEPPVHVAGRAAAAALLVQLGDQRAPMRALEDRERAVSVGAALALTDRAPDAAPERAIDVLLTALDDADLAQAGEILQVLARVGSRLEEPLLELLRQEPRDEAARRRRRRAATLAGRLSLSSAVAPLVGLSCDGDTQLRLAALQALIAIPGSEPRQWALFLADPELTVALRALRALADREQPGRPDTPGAARICRWLRDTPASSSRRWRWWRAWRLLLAGARRRTDDYREQL